MKRNYKKLLLSAGIVVLALTIFSFDDDLFQVSKNLDVFASLYKEVNINYVDDINSAKMLKTGVDAMLDGLDPYTEFYAGCFSFFYQITNASETAVVDSMTE